MEPAQRCQAVLRELEKILPSPGFVQSKRLTEFLRFIVERHLAGKDDELKETVLAVEVFGRKADYDPKQDSIVRTEAGRLRSKLVEYYAGEGRNDSVVIELPKGRYTPVFHLSDTSTVESRRTFRPQWSRVGLVTLALVLAIAVFGYWFLRQKSSPIDIAVLPLKNLSPDGANEYFADGLTDEIIHDLATIEGLAVRSRTSSFVFKNAPRNLGEVGKQLGVDYIVEGSVLREGSRVRINAQLMRARDDFMLWSGRFDRETTDIFAIQDEISRGVVNNLRLKLGHKRRRYETSVEAYDLYLQALGMRIQGPVGVVQSIDAFEQAIAKDPFFAPAYAGLGAAYANRSVEFPVDHPPDELQKMRAAAEKAIELDPLLAEAHEAFALVYSRYGQWEQAEKSFRYALQLDPNRSITYINFVTRYLWVLGRINEALELLHTAERADPFSSELHSTIAFLLISAGRFSEAAEHCQKMSAQNTLKMSCLAHARIGQGRFSEAIQLLTGDKNPSGRGFLGYAYARSGHRDEAEKMAAVARYPNEKALIFAGLGDKERTFEALDQMAIVGAQRIGQYLNYPELALLQGDPRLKPFRKKVGLPD
jgi:TolB-like protein